MWKEYPLDTRYLVSDSGVVRGVRGWYLKPAPTTGEYLTVYVSGKTRKLAHVVAETWIGPRPDGMEVAHLDGDNQNNDASNLSYVTHSENERHKAAHGTSAHGERNGRAKLTDAQVDEIRGLLARGVHQEDVAISFGITQGYVSAIRRCVSR